MPAIRLSHRRRSSLATSAFNPVKAGIYGIQTSPRAVTFAPNVTPGTYTEPEASTSESTPEPSSPTAKLFPPSELPAPPSRRRVPPGKRRSLGYIPRPPNAFMLFRADFVRQKHVPGSIETNHGSLSKIIGNCWRSLPLNEKRDWEIKAKHAKAEHKARYPEYRFRPVHNKNKDKKKEKATPTVEDERRCEEVAQLLLEGKKGDELAEAIRSLDQRKVEAPAPIYYHRRSSSVPLPESRFNPIALPSLPFLALSRPDSPVGNISRSTRMVLGQRRASSARPAVTRQWSNFSWGAPTPSTLPRDESPLPEVDTSLFEPGFLDSNFSFSNSQTDPPFNFNDLFANLPPHAQSHNDIGISPLDNMAAHGFSMPDANALNCNNDMSSFHPDNMSSWMPNGLTHSQPSSAYSGSPAHSDMSLPVVAPQPQHAKVQEQFDFWKEMGTFPGMQQQGQQADFGMGLNAVHGQQICGGADPAIDLAHYATGLETLFDNSFCGIDPNSGVAVGFEFNEMHHEF
ncbi:hypothetical protein SERLA73DRAFT_84283 [Serpula lacrymans var. lacrymans S7.3]|uniref:HMG box domain-containing protein n=2 Tax=Serpula lacrymans var. lacrymans TaxID=341189 RepID=F8PJE9_SERL3|nr:uncharacterized protein SERLADRAFT_413248 [Serpula lacrymans var. lacrymans S7.9]EGO04087.1 hypothetical protein SERLA73DRAFT_84283 [Serpula lacrymans var. lacrymans S7.3]EGO30007.1 hypothetical protein SERLADRAFT_413248 [Serpula lacrymans var. lacrymans S7.9]